MEDIPLSALLIVLGVSLILSACFSGSETALMTLNRYRLRHLARDGHRGARIADRLLQRPDRLIGVILIGNNLVNILAAQIATVIALRIGGQSALAIATGILTLIILIFSEVTPKTLAALHPERVAFPASFALAPLLRVFYPVVWLINAIANGMLRGFGVRPEDDSESTMSREELRTVVNEAGAMIPRRHQRMLTNILDLEKATVEDIMIPRTEIVGLDLNDDWDDLIRELAHAQYTRMPVYRGSVDEIEGVIHVRRVLKSLLDDQLTREELVTQMTEAYFVPEATPLHVQLVNFQTLRRRMGLIVDEYGDIMGLITLEDLLEEIVGEFTTDPAEAVRDVHPQPDGSYLVEGSASVRELNRVLGLQMSTSGPKTLNGLILEYMETIPEPGTSLLLDDFPITIMQTQDNRVKIARIQPRRTRPPPRPDPD